MAKMELMDSEGFAYMRSGLVCIIMLKLFHDVGIDVSRFTEWMPGYYRSVEPTDDIFYDGMKALFPDMEAITPYEDKERMIEIGELAGFDEESVPEKIMLFQEVWISSLLKKNPEKVQEIVEDCNFEWSEANLIVLTDNSGIALKMEYEAYYYDVAEELIKTWKALKKLEGETE